MGFRACVQFIILKGNKFTYSHEKIWLKKAQCKLNKRSGVCVRISFKQWDDRNLTGYATPNAFPRTHIN